MTLVDRLIRLHHQCAIWFQQWHHHRAVKLLVSAGLIVALLRPDQVHIAIVANMLWLWLEP